MVCNLRIHTRETTCVTAGRIDGKSTIDVTTSLVELDGLPRVFGCLADARAVLDVVVVVIVVYMSLVRLDLLVLDVALDLILTEAKRKIQFKGPLLVLARLRLLKARLIRVGRVARTALRCTAWILRSVIV